MKLKIKAYQKDPGNDLIWAEIQDKYMNLIYRKASRYRGVPFYDDLIQAGLLGLHQAVLEYNREDLNPMTWIYQHVNGKIQKEFYTQTQYSYYYKFKPTFVDVTGFDKSSDKDDFEGEHAVNKKDKAKIKKIEQDLDYLEEEQLCKFISKNLTTKQRFIFEFLVKNGKAYDPKKITNMSRLSFHTYKAKLKLRVLEILEKYDK